ncbi:MAG: PIN domain-containing protein [Planctomycetes bacterium]|nr:PIN domain-containing protein [Planctomycetota bacterium]
MDDWVFIDTCIWASFFTKPSSLEKQAIDDLIDADRAALIGPIVAEVLLGFRRKDQADWIASRLRFAHFTDILWNDWRAAADMGREMAAKGHRLPLTDLIVATVAKRVDAYVYTTDPHFDLISDLKRHQP